MPIPQLHIPLFPFFLSLYPLGLPSAPSPKSTSSVSAISASGPAAVLGNSNSWGGPPPPRPPPPTQAWMDDQNNNKKLMRPKKLPLIEVTQNFDSEFDMAPLETVSPCDFLAPLKQDDSVFFVGSLNASSVPKAQSNLKLEKIVQFHEIFRLKSTFFEIFQYDRS